MSKLIWKFIVTTIIVTTIFFLFYKEGYCKKPQINTTVQVTVDCSSKPQDVTPLVGLLLSVNANTPSDKYITPLQPSYWRISSQGGAVHNRISSLGAKPILILSDFFHYPSEKRANWVKPIQDLNNWNSFVGKTVTDTKMPKMNLRVAKLANFNTKRKVDNVSDFIYDIWNEPNSKNYWTDTKEDFFETFKVAHDKIRSLPGGDSAQICGPSISKFDTAYIQSFLDYCLKNNLQLDVLAWHEFKDEAQLGTIETDIKWAKANWVNNPKYAKLKIKQVFISEFLAQKQQYDPSSLLANLFYLEKGGIDAACKSCWADSNGISNCFNNSLDGMLDGKTFEPRAIWWAYYYYSLSTSKRLVSASNMKNVVSFANFSDSAKNLQLIVSYYGDQKRDDNASNVTINLNNLKNLEYFTGRQSVNIKVFKIPNSGEAVLSNPPLIASKTVRLSNGSAKYSINVELKSAYIINVN